MRDILFARRLLAVCLLLFAPAVVLAQSGGPPDDGAPPGRRPQFGPGGGFEGGRPMMRPPLMMALDTDRDGELSEAEIRNAAKALRSLDRNGDGVLDRTELGPGRGRMGGPGGDGPQRGGRFRRPPGEGFGGPPGAGRGGPPDDAQGEPPAGPPHGGRFGRFRGDAQPDGPPDGGPPPGLGRGRPRVGHVLPPFVSDELDLTPRQQKQIAEVEKEVKAKLESILTPDQLRQARQILARGPRGPGGRMGPGRGRPPGGRPPANDDEDPPVRPQRPRNP